MAQDRSATATIRGYVYQFDKTILEILRLSRGSHLVVEGLEDLDNVTPDTLTGIQCKYYASKKYSPAVIRDAVIAMLDDCIERQKDGRPLGQLPHIRILP